jgi:hypothetical protein
MTKPHGHDDGRTPPTAPRHDHVAPYHNPQADNTGRGSGRNETFHDDSNRPHSIDSLTRPTPAPNRIPATPDEPE